jgi:site-specific recombinase XerD
VFDQRGNRKYLNGVERRAFLHAVAKERDPLRRAFCLALFYSGCRISEALSLTVERFDLAGKALVFETLKQRRRGCFRAVPIPDSLTVDCRELAAGLKPSARLWPFSRPTAYRLIKQYMALAGISGGHASPKGLRHGFAVACLAQKIPLTTVKNWLGHARLETTAIYLDVSGDEERELAKRLWQEG